MVETGKTADPVAPVVARSDLFLSHPTPTQRVTSVLLNGKNFQTWPNSLRLYLGCKRKIKWLLGKEVQPDESDPKYDEWFTDNCIILGWMFNSMEEQIYTMFMYHNTVLGLWTALSKMYAHDHFDSCIFELYQDISHAS